MALDEASFCLNHTQAYAYGRRGQRVVVPRPGRRGARYSLLVCADRRGVLRYVLHPGSITGRIFQDFLSALPAVQGRSLVMDNAVIHHSKRILPGVARLAEDRDLSLRYLPPYCPELNPVELVFNALRTHVRQRAPRCESQLRSAIDEGLRSLTPEATGRMFDRCLGCSARLNPHREFLRRGIRKSGGAGEGHQGAGPAGTGPLRRMDAQERQDVPVGQGRLLEPGPALQRARHQTGRHGSPRGRTSTWTFSWSSAPTNPSAARRPEDVSTSTASAGTSIRWRSRRTTSPTSTSCASWMRESSSRNSLRHGSTAAVRPSVRTPTPSSSCRIPR